ncbi:LDB3 [Lepeophtheirus salmonis]|uniref:LDB3 n=2 Tax=Lepeophtheirus salmonis TaxID=72036 RepID=A0A7R8CDX1_LEPSM|nr:PDZ and LIM domain protein 3-like [Lepeophtheirus salmonis]CAB4054153.1 LDB3 [Lepeophtheirus salmonis]CAF2752812.1 LDB3 [Lepeophtheirus salmonis]
MSKEFIEVELIRPNERTPWGLRIGGGKDRGRVLVLEKVTCPSLAYTKGLRAKDYIVEVNGVEVFDLEHNQCACLIKTAGTSLTIKIERGDNIIPNLELAFPKKKASPENSSESIKPRPYWIRSIESGQGVRSSSGFTTVGKPKISAKQYNSPFEMYSEEALDEIMKEGTLDGNPINFDNIMNPTGREFDSNQSSVLALLNEDPRLKSLF